jgi:uncharacterized RmlC-like cupin family protein
MGSIEEHTTDPCVLVRAGDAAQGHTGVMYAAGISAASAGARALCLQLAGLPPGARSRAHRHDDHESAAYVISGEMVLWFGDRLEHKVAAGPGDFIYIPAATPHLVLNPSPDEPAVAVLARTDPDAQEEITALPHLDDLEHLRPGR